MFPGDLAFRAMTFARLGDGEAARRELERLHATVAERGGQGADLLEEVESTVQNTSPSTGDD